MMTIRPILIMAGGTGGHVFPALAVADELRIRGIPVVWLGTRAGIEARVVPQAGFSIEWLSISGLRGKGLLSTLLMPLKLVIACTQAMRVLFRRKPCAVLGMGGFVAGPGGLMAWLLRKPLLIHEQNAIPGLTNKLLSLVATQALEAFPGALGKKAICVGNPVRKNITDISLPEQRFVNHKGALRVLVVGGSLGAARLNELVPEAISMMKQEVRPEVLHQAGANNLETTLSLYKEFDVEARVEAFIDDISDAYSWADIVVCRAGAMTVFELAAAGLGSILIPYPYAVDDHQTANAHYLERVGAAIVCQQKDVTSEWLSNTILQLVQQRDRVLKMAKAAREQAKPDAANRVAAHCMSAGGLS
jgi:UDP-N-acetylglucosamine--N-acetylmuramyl-(pentapeptide) pyrophosphoryl-undecaprenol N-acetylglucosamine transferase